MNKLKQTLYNHLPPNKSSLTRSDTGLSSTVPFILKIGQRYRYNFQLLNLSKGQLPSDIGYLLAKNLRFGFPFIGINTIGLRAAGTVRMAVSKRPTNKHLCSNSVQENVPYN